MSFGFGFGFPKNYVAALFNTPASLFTTGVNGAWYDPSDFSTLFQDAAGTTPVTAVGQPVGLMLDKSKGLVLGPEQVYTSSISGLPAGGGTRFYPVNMQNMVSGKPYKITFTISKYSGTGFVGLAGAAPAGVTQLQYLGNGTFSCIQFPTGSGVIVFFTLNTNTADFSNISVRELPGNHAFNGSGNSANFPVLSARYNLLTKTEQFDDAVWNLQSTTVTANAALSPRGDMTADKIVSTGSSSAVYQAISFAAGIPVTISVSASPAELDWLVISVAAITTAGNVWFNVATGVIGTISNPTAYVASISKEANGNCRCSITFTPTGADLSGYLFIGGRNSDNTTAATVGSGIYLWGADLRISNDALNQPAYQRVNTATDYDTVGFKPYLSFNGVNQWLQTNSIDFTYGDKMFVCAGARKLSDAGYLCLCEFGTNVTSINGSFSIFAPDGVAGTITYSERGTAFVGAQANNTSFNAPLTFVASGVGSISAPNTALRVNGSQVAQSTATQGTGNYGNYPLYIGARAGSILWFNGRLYGLVVAGKAASASEIASTETWLNQKTGAY